MITRTILLGAPEVARRLGDVMGRPMQAYRTEIHYVHWASKAYEDESVFMSEAHLGCQ